MQSIILASSSPRRKQLLELLRIPFTVDPSNFEEIMDQTKTPEELVKELALGKAQDVAKKHKNAIVIGADSFVVLGNKYFGKPKSKDHAKEMLLELSGKQHTVITGMAIIDTKTNRTTTAACKLKIWIKNLTQEEIDAYIATGEPMDKAGAYAVQELGSVLIEKTEGDFLGGVGLSLFQLTKALNEFGIKVL